MKEKTRDWLVPVLLLFSAAVLFHAGQAHAWVEASDSLGNGIMIGE